MLTVMPTPIRGLEVVETGRFNDSRGAFARLFCDQELAQVLGPRKIVQINLSRTHAIGALRGMHYQLPPVAEMKLIRCLRGRVLDVGVDLRAGSPSFLHWHAEELSADNARMIIIPEGCAHGFQALERDSELLYLHTAAYSPDSERGVPHDDPRLKITWPLAVSELSARDHSYAPIAPAFAGIES